MPPYFILSSKEEDTEELNPFLSSISSKFLQLWKQILMNSKLIYFIVGVSILFVLIFNAIPYFEKHSSPTSTFSNPDPIRVISRPHALIFLDFGSRPEFTFNKLKNVNPLCETLPLSIVGKSGFSVDTLATCIRLYDNDSCYGNSTAVYPKIQKEQPSKIPFLQEAKSMGSCFQNELDGASSFQYDSKSGSGSRFIHFQKKKRSNGTFLIPDELEVKERLVIPDPKLILPMFGRSHIFKRGPVKYFVFGRTTRLEFIEAVFSMKTVQEIHDDPTDEFPPNSHLSDFQEPGDKLGVFIPLKFKPSVKLSFYQTESNRKEMEQVETVITDHLRGNPKGEIKARIDIHYEPETSTRPAKFFYWLKFEQRVQIFLLSNYPE